MEIPDEYQGTCWTYKDYLNEKQYELWEVLGIRYGGYSSVVDQQIYDVAKHIVEHGGESDGPSEIGRRLGMDRHHVELIQYILAGVQIDGEEVFGYGTSPRVLFTHQPERARKLLDLFELALKCWED